MSRLERWSRAKRGLPVEDASAADAQPVDERVPEGQPVNETVNGTVNANRTPPLADNDTPPAQEVDADVPAPGSLDHTLPDPETLQAGSDFSAFMAQGVSSTLRRKALRRLWSTGDYNLRDGLNDYDQDFKAQLKPMAADMADKVRQWSKKLDEALDEPTAEDAPEEHLPQAEETQPEQSQAADAPSDANATRPGEEESQPKSPPSG